MQTTFFSQQSSSIELLPKEIRELLFVNPTIPMSQIKLIIDKLANNCSVDFHALKKLLKENIESQRKAAMDDQTFQEELCEKVKTHINEWDNEFGQVYLKDVLKIPQHLGIPVQNILEKKYLTPVSIGETLSEYIIGQDEYVSKLSLAFYMHLLRSYYAEDHVNMPQSNLLVYGPTGSGKTYAIQVLSKLFGIPFGIVNCNSLVKEGIVGQSSSSVFTEIYKKNNNSVASVERSVILFDEFDKISDESVRNEILSIIDDDGKVFFNDNHGNRNFDSIQISTRGIMFVFTGVFDVLRRSVEKRLNISSLGFSAPSNAKKDFCFYEHVTLDDFKSANLKPEMLGRIREIAYVRGHTEETIAQILMNSAGSPLLCYKNYFEQHGISLSIDEDGVKAIAKLAVEKQLGARGLKTMLWQLLSDEMADVTDKRDIVINPEFITTKKY